MSSQGDLLSVPCYLSSCKPFPDTRLHRCAVINGCCRWPRSPRPRRTQRSPLCAAAFYVVQGRCCNLPLRPLCFTHNAALLLPDIPAPSGSPGRSCLLSLCCRQLSGTSAWLSTVLERLPAQGALLCWHQHTRLGGEMKGWQTPFE